MDEYEYVRRHVPTNQPAHMFAIGVPAQKLCAKKYLP